MCRRVILYAPYSTDQQNPASIETQLDLGASFVWERGWKLNGTYIDAGVSGALGWLTPAEFALTMDCAGATKCTLL